MVRIGTTLYEWEEDDIGFIIIQGRFGLCAYLGIDNKHPLAGFNHNEIPLKCHGGLTCSRNRDGSERSRTIWKPLGYYWYGWSYIDRKWELEEVIEDSKETIKDFKKLVRLIELTNHKEAYEHINRQDTATSRSDLSKNQSIRRRKRIVKSRKRKASKAD